MFSTKKIRISLFVSFVFLYACSGSENREQEYFNRAQAFFNENDFDKTRVELKNVLQINPKNVDARYLMALLAERNQNWRKMYGLLLGVVEERPEFLEAQNKLGKLFLLSGQLDKALESSELVLTKDQNNIDALIIKAAVFMRKKETVKSEEIIQSVLATNPGNVEATLMLARQYEKDKIEDALVLINNAILKNPDDVNLAMFKINYLVKLKDFQSAEKVFLALINQFPDQSALYYNVAKFYIAWGKIDKGEKVLRDYIARKPDEHMPKLVLADYLLQQKGLQEAENALKGFIEENAEDYELRFALAKVYRDKPDQAIEVLNQIVAADKEGLAGQKASNLLAMYAIKQGDKDKARQILNDILQKDSRNSEALMLRSNLLVDEGNFEAAIADLRMVMRDNPSSEKAFMLSASAHLKSGFFDLAEDSLEKALLINPKNEAVRKDLARLMVRNKNEQGAIELLEKGNNAADQDSQVLSMLVDLHIRTKEWDKAIEVARSIPEEDNAGLSSYKLAQIYFAQKKYDLAAEEYLKVLAVKPLAIDILSQLSKSYLAMGMPDKAENLLNKLVAEHPENTALLNLNGSLYRSFKQYDKAQLIFEKVIDQDKNFAPGYQNLAATYINKNDLKKAKDILKQGLVLLPDNSNLLIGIASLYEKSSDLNAAIDTYTHLLKVQPENKIAANNLAALIAVTSDDPERLKYALGLVKVFKHYKVPSLLDTYGWLSYLTGDFDEAVIALEKVVALVPGFAEFEYHLGMIYAANGRTEEAKLALEKAVSSGADFVGIDKAKAKLSELKG
ncbi:MAG: tetratricopeptide repeat protein [Methylococcaceae bacterium]|nr:tetratricopeptide repeat protein [Methylococcaceae bacterium]